MEGEGIIKTEIKIGVKDWEFPQDDKYELRLKLGPEFGPLVESMLKTGAPVWIGIQRKRSESGTVK